MDISPIRRPPSAPTETLVPDLSDGAEAGLYLALFELVEEGLIITSDETILEVNSAACHLLDRSYPQLVGRPLADLFPSEAAFLAARAALFVEGASRGSLLLGMPSGERRHLRCLAAARVRPGVHALVLSPDTAGIPDLTPRPAPRDEVWPRLAAAIRQPVLVVDADGRVNAANAAAQAQFGSAGASLVGTALDKLSIERKDLRRVPGPRPGWEVLILPGAAAAPVLPHPGGDERHRRIFKHLPLPALLCERDSLRILDANPAAENAYGYLRSRLLRLRLPDLLPPGGEADPRAAGSVRHRHQDGSEFEVNLVVTELPAAGGKTDLLLLHTPLARPTPVQQYAGELFALNQDGVLVLDAGLRIIAVNPALCRITGFGKQALLGQSASILLAEGQPDPFADPDLARSGRWRGEVATRREAGEAAPGSLQIARVGAAAKTSHYLVLLRDLAERSQLLGRLAALESATPPTTASGRQALAQPFATLSTLARRERRKLALLVIDLVGFHRINARVGETAGDQVLDEIALRLQAAAPAEALVARLSGDAFVLLAPGLHSEEQAAEIAEAALDAIAAPLAIAGQSLSLDASVGIALQPDHGEDLGELLGAAERALGEARECGLPVRFFEPGTLDRELARASLEGALRLAPERGELALHWQPRYTLADGRLTGAEALLRWQHPQLGLLDAERFVPAALRSGGIRRLGAWALAHACERMAGWREAHGCDLSVAVNVSAAELAQAGFVDRLERILAQHKLPAESLELELTECAELPANETAMSNLYALQEAGVRLRVDRFGSAQAPLAVLRHLPVSGLKIDPQFIRDLKLGEEGLVLVRAMLDTARGLGLDVVAAGVEHAEQRDLLARHGCQESQGRLHGAPVSSEAFGRLLAAAARK